MKSGIARIVVQSSFCRKCSNNIKVELLKIENITNVYLYPIDTLVVFNFVKANELAMALNTLTALGYPPKGDKIDVGNFVPPRCGCFGNMGNDTLEHDGKTGLGMHEEQSGQYWDVAS